jgi:hypothetical protein
MNEQKYVTYRDLIFSFVLLVAFWFLHTVQMDRMSDKINELNLRLSRTEYMCYGTGQTQSN